MYPTHAVYEYYESAAFEWYNHILLYAYAYVMRPFFLLNSLWVYFLSSISSSNDGLSYVLS